MNTRIKTLITSMTYSIVAAAALFPMSAHAAVGVVKVDCSDDCDRVTLGQICDTYFGLSIPVGLSCENTADPGRGPFVRCGNGICTPFGTMVRGDQLGSYCFGHGAGNDVLVMCERPTSAATALDEAATRAKRETLESGDDELLGVDAEELED